MSAAVQSVLDADPEDQLHIALDLLRSLTCDHADGLAHYKREFGLAAGEARVLHYLAVRAPRVCSRRQILDAVHGPLDQPLDRIVEYRVWVLRTRLKGEGVSIHNTKGAGYWLSVEDARKVLPPKFAEPLIVPVMEDEAGPRRRSAANWSEMDVAEMQRMLANGSDFRSVAEELDRSPAAVREKVWRRRTGRERARLEIA